MRSGRYSQNGAAVLSLVLVILGPACGGGRAATPTDATPTTPLTAPATTASGEGGSTASTSAAAPDDVRDAVPTASGGCTVAISGDRDESWTFEQAITSFSTDYWLDEEELREVIEFMGEDITGGSYDELVESGVPIVTLLQISCSDPENLIQGALVTHTNATLTSDLPMGPGRYAISGGLFDADGPAGTMIADLSVDEDEIYGTIAGSGSLEVTQWDRERIEGSLSFAAREAFVDDPREIEVTVSFSFVCREWFSGC
jgi:hypothetical protein